MSFKPGRLPDGSMAFKVILPEPLADLFEEEMQIQDRKKLTLARYIIGMYFRRKQFEEFTQPRLGRGDRQGVPHFGDELHLQRAATLRRTSR